MTVDESDTSDTSTDQEAGEIVDKLEQEKQAFEAASQDTPKANKFEEGILSSDESGEEVGDIKREANKKEEAPVKKSFLQVSKDKSDDK